MLKVLLQTCTNIFLIAPVFLLKRWKWLNRHFIFANTLANSDCSRSHSGITLFFQGKKNKNNNNSNKFPL